MARAARRLLGTVVAGALLAACSSGPPAASRTTTQPPAPSTTTGAAPTTTTGAAPTTTASPAASAACSSGVLHLGQGGTAASAGTSRVSFVLKNEGPGRCTIDGYPEVILFGSSGAGGSGAGPRLAITVARLGAAPEPVALAPGESADFVLSIAEVPVNGVGCQGVASLEVAAPGGGGVLSLPTDLEACGGTVGVYPVTSAS